MPFYGRETWDPKLIVSQICVLQATHYICMGSLLGVLHALFGVFVSLGTMFDYEKLSVRTAPGWVPIAASVLCAATSAVFVSVVVERSKKCADFAFTLYFVHFFFCLAYNGFPATWEWWIVNVLCVVVLGTLSERLCIRRELSDIDL
jgi:hypothetical protein